MLNVELLGKGEGGHTSPKKEAIQKAVESLDGMKREFIQKCLHSVPTQRGDAHTLLKHPVLQEVMALFPAILLFVGYIAFSLFTRFTL